MTSVPPPSRSGRWLIATCLLLAAAIAWLWHAEMSVREKIALSERSRELQAIADLKIEYLGFWIRERQDDAEFLGKAPLMAQAAESGPGRNKPDNAKMIRGRLETISKAYVYHAVMLLDHSGQVRAETGDWDEDTRQHALAAAQDALRAGKAIISPTYESTAGGRRHLDIDIATPVFAAGSPEPRTVGALVLHLDPRTHLDPLLRHWPSASESGETLLAERAGDRLHFLNTLRHTEAASWQWNADDPRLPAAMAARGQRGVIAGIDYRGVPVLAAIGQVPGVPWSLVAKLDRAEILAPVRQEALRAGVLYGLILIAFCLTMLAWHRRRNSEIVLAREIAGHAALAASEARFRKLNEHGWDFTILFDRGMVVCYASAAVDRYLGRLALGEPIANGTVLVHPDDLAQVGATRKAALAMPGVPQPLTHRLSRKNGGWLTVEASFTNFFDEPDIGALAYVAHDISQRVEMEAALRESETHYRRLFELSPEAVMVFKNERIVFANAAASRLFHAASPQDLLGRDWRELVAEEDWPVTEARIAALMKAETLTQPMIERRHHTLDGQTIMLESAAALIEFEGGPAILSSARDVTERKRMEQALVDGEARLAAFVNASCEGIAVSEKGRVLDYNKQIALMLGYTNENLKGHAVEEFIAPEDRERMLENMRRQQDSYAECDLLRRDGSRITVEVHGWSHPHQGTAQRITALRDITAYKQAQKALRESEERYRVLFQLSPDAVFAHRNNVIFMANDAAARFFRAGSAEALVGKDWHELIPAEHWPRIDARVALLAGGTTTFLPHAELTYRALDGTTIHAEASAARIVVDGLPAIISVMHDLTGRLKAEAARLTYARQQRDTLVREVHHRIKNHLQGLAGLLHRNLAQGLPPRPALEEVAAQINAISIVHGLQGSAAHGRVGLREMVSDIAAFLAGLQGVPLPLEDGERQCFQVRLCLCETACRWLVPDDESVPLALIVNELLTNAARHRAGAAPLSLALACDDAGARLTIRNPGRLAGLSFDQGKGLGTGLSLVRSLMPPAGLALSHSETADGMVETRLVIDASLLQRAPETGV